MNPVHVVRGKAIEIEMREYPERDLRRETLSIWRDFVQFDVAIALLDRRDPIRAMRGKVCRRHCAAVFLGVSGDALREFTAIKRFAVTCGDDPQRRREFGTAKNFTRFGRVTLGQKMRHEIAEAREVAGSELPV